MRSGRGALAELVKRDKRIDGVFCSSDMLAMGVLTERARGASTFPISSRSWASATSTSPPTAIPG